MEADPGKRSASAASTFNDLEVTSLIELARCLPEGWCVRVEPPHGQVSIVPIRETRHWHHGALVVDRNGRFGPALVTAADVERRARRAVA